MHKLIIAFAMTGATIVLATSFAKPAHAQYCEGTVHGLTGNYDPATSSGFLAGPRSAATQVGEVFNGDKLEIFDRKGNWYRVATAEGAMLEGRANARWIYNYCGY